MNWIIGLIFALSFAWGLAGADVPAAPPAVCTDPTGCVQHSDVAAQEIPLNQRPHESIIFVLGFKCDDGTYVGTLFVHEDGLASMRTAAQESPQDVQQVVEKLEKMYGPGHAGLFTYPCSGGKPYTGKGGPTTSI